MKCLTTILFYLVAGHAVLSQVTIQKNDIDSTYLERFASKYQLESVLKQKLFRFYTKNNYRLAWFVNNSPVPHASLLINVINDRTEHGIMTNSVMDGYNLSDTLAYLEESVRKESTYYLERQKSFDVMLTASYFKHIPAMWTGVIDPHSTNDIEWYLKKNTFEYATILDSILSDSPAENPFLDYRKFHNGYFLLKEQLKKHYSIKENGGWPLIATTRLSKGDTGKVVMTLAERLHQTGDLSGGLKEPRFDNQMKAAVKRFQERHGLKQDGIVGKETLRELNTSVDERIKQIIVNLERWRWVPPLRDSEYLYVNIPEYHLYAFNGDNVDLQMPVIVGTRASHTVVFSDELEYVVLNPYWNIPYSIAVEEMLPKRQRDSLYFRRNKIEVGINGNYDSLDESLIDWTEFGPDNFPYTLRQKPGPWNQLGSIKFIFPNKFSIYLHDTPSKELFASKNRDLSHGCIRVAEPVVLADYLLKNRRDFSRQKLNRIISGKNQEDLWITLEDSMPVYILYFTVWVNRNGETHYRKDIYGHDRKLNALLFDKF
jgi:L,D-transpeptidase YcbB